MKWKLLAIVLGMVFGMAISSFAADYTAVKIDDSSATITVTDQQVINIRDVVRAREQIIQQKQSLDQSYQQQNNRLNNMLIEVDKQIEAFKKLGIDASVVAPKPAE